MRPEGARVTNGSGGGGGSDNFLQKLFGLTSSNARIREAMMAMLLEPMRRSRVDRSKGVNPPDAPSPLRSDVPPEAMEGVRPPLPSALQFI